MMAPIALSGMTEDWITIITLAHVLEVVVEQYADAVLPSSIRAAVDLIMAMEAAGFSITLDRPAAPPVPIIHLGMPARTH